LSDKRSATGSCTRCRATLDLASVRVGDAWYCRLACSAGEAVHRPAEVEEEALINRPRRHFAQRDPKELRRTGA
jgi:hypothetical protein